MLIYICYTVIMLLSIWRYSLKGQVSAFILSPVEIFDVSSFVLGLQALIEFQGTHICCFTCLFPTSVQPEWELPLTLIIFFLLMAFNSPQQEELQSVPIVAQGLPPTRLPRSLRCKAVLSASDGSCAETAVTSEESWLWVIFRVLSYLPAGYWRRAACYVQTSVALPFWNRGVAGRDVKITTESATQSVLMLPERELLSYSSDFSRQIFHFIIFHEFGEGGQSALHLRASQNQN